MGVPAGNGEIDLRRPDAGPDGCVSGQLPARAQPDVAICSLQYDRFGQPPRGRCEPDQRWKRQHCSLEIGVTGSGEDLLQYSGEALMRQLSGAEQVMEPGNGRDPVVFVNLVQSCCNRDAFVHGLILAQRILGCEGSVRVGRQVAAASLPQTMTPGGAIPFRHFKGIGSVSTAFALESPLISEIRARKSQQVGQWVSS